MSALARATDPITSHEAAEYVQSNSINADQKARVLAALRKLSGMNRAITSKELAAHPGIDRYVIARRLPELERDGVVAQEPPRLCSIGKRKAVTWRALPVQMEL